MNDLFTFWIIEFLSDGIQHIESKGIFFLACLTEDKERLVVWGSEENHYNISLVAKQSSPFGISCCVVEPKLKAVARYGDNIWVDEEIPLGIVKCP